MIDMSITPASLDVFHLEVKLKTPRRNAFGTMLARPALVLRLKDHLDFEGWGEVFCNWPAFGALHRKRILEQVLTDQIVGRRFDNPQSLSRQLIENTRRIVIQSNEPGPFEQCIAGIDIAAWDLAARREDIPLHQLIKPNIHQPVPVYASALTPENYTDLVPGLLEQRWTGFKAKVGFGLAKDMEAVGQLRKMIGEQALMLDANQAWDVTEAKNFIEALSIFQPSWIEEPIIATSPERSWRLLQNTPVPIAGGENLRGRCSFAQFAKANLVKYLQPDAIKWGGISGLIEVADIARHYGLKFAPHYLGSGFGLMATAHAAKALGAEWLEVDVSENPLRTEFVDYGDFIKDGHVVLSDAPGIGIPICEEKLATFVVSS